MHTKRTDGLSSTIYHDLKTKIEQFEYKPGDRISETRLAKLYNVSRTPIKHSLARLENDGIIYVKPQIGTFVSPIDTDHIIEYFTIRKLLEQAIIADVQANISAANIARLEVNIKMQQALFDSFATYDQIELSKKIWILDNEFHEIIFSCVEKNFIWDFIMSQSSQFNRFRLLSASYNEEILKKVIIDHTSILNYIKGDTHIDVQTIYDTHILLSLEEKINEMQAKYPQYF